MLSSFQLQVFLILPSVYAYTCPSSSPSISTYTVVSDTTNLVTGPDVPSQTNAIESYYAPGWSVIPGALWIWDSYHITDPAISQTIIVTKQFYISGFPISALLEIEVDDYALVNINGNTGFCDINSSTSSTPKKCNVQRYLYPGSNSIIITATNQGYPGLNNIENPGGVTYKLIIKLSG